MKKLILITIILGAFAMSVPASADSVILPHRIIDGRTQTVVDFEGLLSACSTADIVALGEQHDDPGTHLIELAVLEGLYRRHGDVIVSMEMFERDTQSVLDQYLAGEITEEDFLANSRPWGNYDTDYRPVIEFAKANMLPVIAANVPRPLASRIAMGGGYENAVYTEEELPWIASTYEAPEDDYWTAFNAVMTDPEMGEMHVTGDMIRDFYESQVMKDETMAESVTRAWLANPESIVYFFAGAFHVEDYLGTYSRIQRNAPDAETVLILVYPVDDIMAGIPEGASKADFYVLVQAPPVEEEEVEGEETDEGNGKGLL